MPSSYTSISSGTTPSLFSGLRNEECTFNVYPEASQAVYQYNICPLLTRNDGVKKIQVIKDEDTPPTHTRHVYDIAMMESNGLDWDGTLPSNLQCPKGTWICLTVINSRPDHPSEPLRILQVIPISSVEKSNPKASYVIESPESQLQVAFHGGRYMGKKHKALFHFSCDHSQEHSTPNLLWSFNGTHSFSWASKHGCPISLPVSTIHATPTSSSHPDSEPSDRPPQQPEEPDSPEDISTTKGLGAGPITGLTIILFLMFWKLCLRRNPRVTPIMSGTSHVWILRRSPNLARWNKWQSLTRQEEMSVLLDDFSVEGQVPLSPKDSTLPTYGL